MAVMRANTASTSAIVEHSSRMLFSIRPGGMAFFVECFTKAAVFTLTAMPRMFGPV